MRFQILSGIVETQLR